MFGNDLVKELRSQAAGLVGTQLDSIALTFAEAATEIEKLRGELDEADALIAAHVFKLLGQTRFSFPEGSSMENAVRRYEARSVERGSKD